LVLHATTKENKGKELAFEGFKSSFLVDTKDAKVGPLHMIFNLKGVIVEKEYSKVNHFMVFTIICHLYMDVYSTCEYACLLEKNSRRDEY
jgi:hypothetical protein